MKTSGEDYFNWEARGHSYRRELLKTREELYQRDRELADEKRKVKRLIEALGRIGTDLYLNDGLSIPIEIDQAMEYIRMSPDERAQLEESDNALAAAEDEAMLA